MCLWKGGTLFSDVCGLSLQPGGSSLMLISYAIRLLLFADLVTVYSSFNMLTMKLLKNNSKERRG